MARTATESKGLRKNTKQQGSSKMAGRKTAGNKVSGSKIKTVKTIGSRGTKSQLGQLPKNLLLNMHNLMVKSRVIEERMIRLYKMGDAFFWIGGPGEEGFGIPLGLLVDKGQGPNHDWLHLHYRCTPTLVAMGMPMVDPLRLVMNKATDINTGGRNFSNHYCYPKWNVAPVSSPIEVQYSIAIGTAWAQHRRKAKGITIVTGGDAGTAEGDFASCLIWSTRKGNELPMLITVQNNRWGISTNFASQHGEEKICDRGKAFGMRTAYINGNDTVECYLRLQEEINYIRKTGKPVLAEIEVSRLYGHSSASGANLVTDERDVIRDFEKKIVDAGFLKPQELKEIWRAYDEESKKLVDQIRLEPDPKAESIWDHVYVNNENSDWRKF